MIKLENLAKLNYLSTAIEYKENAAKHNCWLTIMHGDDGLYWMVPGGKVRELEAKGYERAQY